MKKPLFQLMFLFFSFQLFAQDSNFPLRFFGDLGVIGNVDQPVKGIAGGLAFCAVLKQDGTVAIWGRYWNGEMNNVGNWNNIRKISAGNNFLLGLKEDSTVVLWMGMDSKLIQLPPDLGKVADIDAGAGHALALKPDGTVVSFGGVYFDSLNATPEGLVDVVSISAGYDVSFVIKKDSTVQTWGARNWAPITDSLKKIKAISVYKDHVLALKYDGTVIGWGDNSYGQMNIPDSLNHVIAISAGDRHSLVLKDDGKAVAWGGESYGYSPVPEHINNIVAISAGWNMTMLLDKNGNVYVMGGDLYGETSIPYGLANIESISNKSGILALKKDGSIAMWGARGRSQASIPPNLPPFKALVEGNEHYVGLKSDGTVLAWGYNGHNQLNVPIGLKNVKDLAAGDEFTMALKEDGTLEAWGYNYSGQLRIPTGLTNVKAISCGGAHTLALKEDGTVESWGASLSAQTSVPVGLTGVKAVAAGLIHSVALKNDGTVVAWGDNTRGQAQVPIGLGKVKAIGAGYYHTAALLENDSLIIWGEFNLAKKVEGAKAISANAYGNVAVLLGESKPSNKLSGYVFFDSVKNCTMDTLEKGLERFIIKAQKGGQTYFSGTDQNGFYVFDDLDTGAYDVTVLRPLEKDGARIQTPICDTTFVVSYSQNGSSQTHNVGYDVKLCPRLEISVGSIRRRRCFASKTNVKYCNTGFAPSYSTTVAVTFPTFVELLSVDSNYTTCGTKVGCPELKNVGEKTYLFSIGLLNAGQCGTISINDSIICGIEEIRNATVCTKATIKGANACLSKTQDSLYNIAIHSKCEGEQLVHEIMNLDTRDMEDSVRYQVLFNNQIASTGHFKLQANQSVSLKYSGNRQYTYTVRVDSLAKIKNSGIYFSTEGNVCKVNYWNDSTYASAQGFISKMPIMTSINSSTDCQPIRDSFDPNDKQVLPLGVEFGNSNGNIVNTQELNYTIRFENTGTDTAYKIMVKDIIDTNLDIRTLRMKASSSPLNWKINGIEKPELEVLFSAINLPSQKADSINSKGYFQFSIYPKANLPVGSSIRNQAAIYFDFNSPIYTNTVLNQIWDGSTEENPSFKSLVQVQNSNITLGLEEITFVNKFTYPNPTKGIVHLSNAKPVQLKITNSQGTQVMNTLLKENAPLDFSAFPNGLYFVEYYSENKRFVEKIMKE